MEILMPGLAQQLAPRNCSRLERGHSADGEGLAQRIQSSLPTTSATDPTSQQRILELETEPVKATQGDTSSPPDPPGTSNSVGMTPIQRALITRKFILRALVRPGSPLGHPRHGQLHGLKKTNLLLCRTQATKIA